MSSVKDTIDIKGVIWEDTVNYKKISTTIMFPNCSFKCDIENGTELCQNRGLAATETQTVPVEDLIIKHMENPLTEAVVLQGLEPLDSKVDVFNVAACLGDLGCKDDLVIYTGYKKEEIPPALIKNLLFLIPGKLIIKWGRFIPNQTPHFDPILGVNLISDNQYAEEYSQNDE